MHIRSTEKKTPRRWKHYVPLYLMALPGLIYLFINNYLPMAGLTIAFRNINYQKGIWNSDWCGLANFQYLFATKDAWVITRNTIGYNVLFIFLETTAAELLYCSMRSNKNSGTVFFRQVFFCRICFLMSLSAIWFMVF